MFESRLIGFVAFCLVASASISAFAQGIPRNPMNACNAQYIKKSEFDVIRPKMDLGIQMSQVNPAHLINAKPTEEEKSAIRAWNTAHNECYQNSRPWLQGYLPASLPAIDRRYAELDKLTNQLMDGKLTYADYARSRASLYNETLRSAKSAGRGNMSELQSTPTAQQPAKPLGESATGCVYKPVMTNEDIASCR